MRALAVEVAARWAVRPHTASSFHDASRNASPLAAGAGGAGRTSSVMRRSSWASSSGTLLSKRSCTTCRGTDRAAEAVMGPIRSRAPPGAWAWRLLRSPAGCWISWVRRRGAARGAARGARAGRARAHLQRLCNLPPRVARPEVLPRRGSARSAAGVSAQRGARSLGAGFGRRLWAQALGVRGRGGGRRAKGFGGTREVARGWGRHLGDVHTDGGERGDEVERELDHLRRVAHKHSRSRVRPVLFHGTFPPGRDRGGAARRGAARRVAVRGGPASRSARPRAGARRCSRRARPPRCAARSPCRCSWPPHTAAPHPEGRPRRARPLPQRAASQASSTDVLILNEKAFKKAFSLNGRS
jgi:hypothetical protein